MKEYEVIWEIFNKCPRNQMRDVFVEEVEIEDPEEYIKKKFQGKEVSYDKTVLNDGTIIFDIVTSQIKQRCVGLSNICYTPINKFPQNS
ncbi:hypothetical protein, partial [Blautia sp. 210820-DFI.6.14]|uniref:hypothetical protein n=1 Tax=Blautia sp. 210820-DFI.6.14 TaxID=2883263 RepID=UPI001D05FDD9